MRVHLSRPWPECSARVWFRGRQEEEEEAEGGALYLFNGPLGDRGGCDACYSWQELAVLLPAHRE